MKETILCAHILIMVAFQGLSAQTVGSGSRLNMTVKKKPVATENTRFSGLSSGSSYKPLSLQIPKALNSFYRSFLFASSYSVDNANLSVSEAVTKNADKHPSALETTIKAEEQLYSSDKITVSNIYPNPASEYAELDYVMAPGIRDAKVIIYNVLGSQMQELPLSKNDRKLRITTSDMPTGLYFYQLALDGKKVATKKMLVRHQQ